MMISHRLPFGVNLSILLTEVPGARATGGGGGGRRRREPRRRPRRSRGPRWGVAASSAGAVVSAPSHSAGRPRPREEERTHARSARRA